MPIPTNGRATVLRSGGAVPTTDPGRSATMVIQFNQVIPKPFWASGPADYYLVRGPVDLRKNVLVDASGRCSYHYELTGKLTATPVGGGEPFEVRIHDFQNGFRHGDQSFVSSHSASPTKTEARSCSWSGWRCYHEY